MSFGDMLFFAGCGFALGWVARPLYKFDQLWERAYQLGITHGRGREITEQWGADVREALAMIRADRERFGPPTQDGDE